MPLFLRRRLFAGLDILCLLLLCAAGDADGGDRLKAQDLQLIGRLVRFVDDGHRGPLAIVYAPDVPGSKDEAAELLSLLQAAPIGDPPLPTVVVPQDRLATRDPPSLILATAGIAAGPLRDAMRRSHAACVTAHLSQVRAGACLVCVRSLPAVDITLNQAAADMLGVHFATALRLMVHEL